MPPGDIAKHNLLMCADYNAPIPDNGICPECKIVHDMQSTYILKAGYPIPLRPRRVLIVDDDIFLRSMVSDYFKGAGYEVYQEADGHMAFEVYRESFPFEFVLTDFWFLPGKRISSCGCKIKTGADLVREIRKLIPNQRMAIMTGDCETVSKSLDESVKNVPILSKPFRLREISKLLV